MKIERFIVGPVSTNCYLTYDEETKEAFLVDPGEEAEKISARIDEKGLALKAILLTHAHFDHILAVPALVAKYGCPVLCGEKEAKRCNDPDYNMSNRRGIPATAFVPDRTLIEGEELELAGVKIRVLETPGHTEGSVCYYLYEQNLLFSGDTLFYESYGRTDLGGGSQSAMKKSLKKKLFLLPPEVQVLPGHMDPTTIGYEVSCDLI